jgi:hypothetical protein
LENAMRTGADERAKWSQAALKYATSLTRAAFREALLRAVGTLP